ncbi:hypothetical protein HUJ04_001222 [Dendroctonus ponderosae]
MQSGTEAGATKSMLNQSKRCPICLDSTKNKHIGVPNRCSHKFCFLCLKTWSKRKNTCPMCRARFRSIIVRSRYTRRFLRRISVRRPSVESKDEEQTYAVLFDGVHRAVFRLLGGIV